jgi:hypothetical protein
MVSIGAIVPEFTEFFSDPLSYAHGHIARLDRRFETMGSKQSTLRHWFCERVPGAPLWPER